VQILGNRTGISPATGSADVAIDSITVAGIFPTLTLTSLVKKMNSLADKAKVVFQRREQYLEAHVPAVRMDRSRAYAFFVDIMLKCAEKHDKRLLVQAELPDPASVLNLISVVRQLVQMNHGTRIAFLISRQAVKGYVPVAIKHSPDDRSEYEFFTTCEQAGAWLANPTGSNN